MHRLNCRLEKFLSDQRGHECAENDDSDEDGVLRVINDFVLEAEQRRNRPERQASGHY